MTRSRWDAPGSRPERACGDVSLWGRHSCLRIGGRLAIRAKPRRLPASAPYCHRFALASPLCAEPRRYGSRRGRASRPRHGNVRRSPGPRVGCFLLSPRAKPPEIRDGGDPRLCTRVRRPIGVGSDRLVSLRSPSARVLPPMIAPRPRIRDPVGRGRSPQPEPWRSPGLRSRRSRAGRPSRMRWKESIRTGSYLLCARRSKPVFVQPATRPRNGGAGSTLGAVRVLGGELHQGFIRRGLPRQDATRAVDRAGICW